MGNKRGAVATGGPVGKERGNEVRKKSEKKGGDEGGPVVGDVGEGGEKEAEGGRVGEEIEKE
eukprot:3051015-Rhodomonas_salina.1